MESLYEIETFKVRLAVAEPELTAARNTQDAAEILRPIYADLDADQEHFVILLLNNKNRVRAYKLISTGSMTASLVHPREVFRSAVLYGAAAIILCHNHPSGNPEPSPEDLDITRRLVSCAEIFGIRVLDHIILGEDSIFSFNNRGMLDGLSSVDRRIIEPSQMSSSASARASINARRAAHGVPPIGAPTGNGGKYRGRYKKRTTSRKDAGIPRGPRTKRVAATPTITA